MDEYTLAAMLMGMGQGELQKVAQYLVQLDVDSAEFLQDQLGVELFDAQLEDDYDDDVSEAQEWHDFDPDC
jgi:hypothetical protein